MFRSRRAGRFAVVLRKAWDQHRDGADAIAGGSLSGDEPRRDEGRVLVSRDRARCPSSSSPQAAARPSGSATIAAKSRSGHRGGDQILYVTPHDPSGVGLLKIGVSAERRMVEASRAMGSTTPDFPRMAAGSHSTPGADRFAPAQVFVARVDGVRRCAREGMDRRSASDGEAPSWSPDASLLYFWSDRDGSPCLWAQRLDPATKRPSGAPLSIQHFHSRGLSWKNLYLGAPDIAVARDKIVFNLGEHTGQHLDDAALSRAGLTSACDGRL